MTSKLVSLLRAWPRITGKETARPAANSGIWWDRLFGEVPSGVENSEVMVEDEESNNENETREASLSTKAENEAKIARNESIARYYYGLTHPAPRNVFDAAANPLSEASLHHVQEEESRRIERPNLDIPIGGGLSYVTLAQ